MYSVRDDDAVIYDCMISTGNPVSFCAVVFSKFIFLIVLCHYSGMFTNFMCKIYIKKKEEEEEEEEGNHRLI